jgi:outer membrane protein OmpA-like peptidoglycan-associated protein
LDKVELNSSTSFSELSKIYTMNSKTMFTGLILVIWTMAGSYVYTCKIMALCPDQMYLEEPSTSEGTINSNDNPNGGEMTSSKEGNPPVAARPDKYTVYFYPNTTKIVPDEKLDSFLTIALAYLSENPDSKMVVEGHTDNIGSEERNVIVGKERAESVKQKFVRAGFNADQLMIESKGLSQPIASNDTEEGRAKNRRTEIYLSN